jgi:hypothetical protein
MIEQNQFRRIYIKLMVPNVQDFLSFSSSYVLCFTQKSNMNNEM